MSNPFINRPYGHLMKQSDNTYVFGILFYHRDKEVTGTPNPDLTKPRIIYEYELNERAGTGQQKAFYNHTIPQKKDSVSGQVDSHPDIPEEREFSHHIVLFFDFADALEVGGASEKEYKPYLYFVETASETWELYVAVPLDAGKTYTYTVQGNTTPANGVVTRELSLILEESDAGTQAPVLFTMIPIPEKGTDEKYVTLRVKKTTTAKGSGTVKYDDADDKPFIHIA